MSDLLAILVSADKQTEITTHEAGAKALTPDIEVLEIHTVDDEQFAVSVRASIKETLKELEELRKSITGPMDKAKKAVDALFKPAKERYESLVEAIDAKLKARKLAQLAADTATKAFAQATAKASPALLAAEPEPEAKAHGVAYTYTWTYTLDDLSQVPREWLTLDHSKVKIHCREWSRSDVIPQVAGITFLRDATVRGTAR